MSFETGTATNPDNLIDKLRIFAVAAGWTENKWTPGSSTDSELYLQKNADIFINLKLQDDNASQAFRGGPSMSQPYPILRIYPSTGFDGGQAVTAQPGTPISGRRSETNWISTPILSYWFFADDDYIHVVVENLANEFLHFGFGQIAKGGTWDGGVYTYGTRWSQSTGDIDVPDATNHSVPFDGNTVHTTLMALLSADVGAGIVWNRYKDQGAISIEGYCLGVARVDGYAEDLYASLPSSFNGTTPFIPIYSLIGRAGDNWSLCGHVKDMRYTSIQNNAPKDIITIGSDDWYIFPMMAKKDPALRDDLPNSGYYAYVYKKVT